MATSAEVETAGGADRFGRNLGLIGLLALAWRAAYVFISHAGDDSVLDLFAEGDAFYYAITAGTVADGDGFVKFGAGETFTVLPAADHPPLTTLLLAPVAKVLPESVLAMRFTMVVVGVLAVLAIGLLGRVAAGPRVGLVAAGVAAVSPNLWMNDAVVMSEAPSALLIALSLWAAYRLLERPSWGRTATLGALLGLTVLTRAEMALLVPFLAAPALLLARSLPLGGRLARLAVVGALVVGMMAPWTLYNAGRFDGPVLISANDGNALWGSSCPVTLHGGLVGGWSLACMDERVATAGSPLAVGEQADLTAEASRLARERGCFGPEGADLDDAERSLCLRNAALAYIGDNLDRMPVVVFARQGRTWGWWRPDQMVYVNTGEGRPEWASWAGYGFLWATLPLTAIGTVVLRRRGVSLLPLGACLLTVLVVVTVFYGIPRFRLPFDVAACVPIAAALVAGWDRYR